MQYIVFFEMKRLTKFYDSIQEMEKNVYIAKDNKNGKFAFLSPKFSTKEEYLEILQILDENNEYIYLGITKDEDIQILTKVEKIDIKKLNLNEYNKIIKLLPKKYRGKWVRF